MSHPEIDFMVAQERRRDELAAAEHSRLVHLALESQSPRPFAPSASWSVIMNRLALWTGQVLYGLGMRISSWGCRMQVRYANLGSGHQTAPCD